MSKERGFIFLGRVDQVKGHVVQRECFVCYKVGHLARDCRLRPQKVAGLAGTSKIAKPCFCRERT